MPDVLVIGSYNRDIVLSVPRFPQPGETLSGTGMAFFDGGKGSNQAVQAARCGASVAMRACIGTDDAGAAALALWGVEGIATHLVQRNATRPTGTALILVDASGENQIVILAGANAALEGTVDLGDAKVVLAQLETPVAATIATFRAARAAGAMTMLNAAPAVPLSDELIALTDLLLVNRTEGAALAGLSEDNPASIAAALASRYSRGVVVTAGADGAIWAARGGQALHVPALPASVVDTTGAGDAFCGALAASLARGLGMDAALRRASAAGALACGISGAVPSLPCLDAIRAAGG